MTCKGCKNVNATVGPKPYYESVSKEVYQNHETTFVRTDYAASIYISNDWTVPGEGETAQLVAPGLKGVAVGTYLYNNLYGYFYVYNWNPKTEIVGVVNENIAGNAQPGSIVPAGTNFIIAPKPCCEDETNTLLPFVAEDFTVPNIGLPLNVKVTSTFGLRVSDVVRIGTGIYKLDSIISSKEIKIINEGGGDTPGTVINALDGNGEYQYLVTSESPSGCSATSTPEARLLVCEGGDERILSGSRPGQVPVLQPGGGNLVRFELLDADVRQCAELVTPVNITPAGLTYTFTVPSTVGFTLNDIVQIDVNNVRFKITALTATTLSVDVTTGAPGVTVTVPAGSLVCKVLTTETILDLIAGTGGSVSATLTALQNQINALNTALGTTNTNLTAEITARSAADTALTSAYQAGDAAVMTAVNNEALLRAAAITAEQNARATAITTEQTARAAAITAEQNARTALSNSLTSSNASGNVGCSSAALTANGQTKVSNRFDTTITNTTTRPMRGLVLATSQNYVELGLAVAGTTVIQYELLLQVDVATIGSTAAIGWGSGTLGGRGHIQSHYFVTLGTYFLGSLVTNNRGFTVNPGQEVRIRGEGRIVCTSIVAGNTISIPTDCINVNWDVLAVRL